MEVQVCKNCRRMFRYIYGPVLCPQCMELVTEEKGTQLDKNEEDHSTDKNLIDNVKNKKFKLKQGLKSYLKDEEEKFEQVRDYILIHPAASVAEISEANDVSPTKLFEWIREERLEFSDDSEYAWFSCQSCGTKIKSGRLCNRCKVLNQKQK